MSVVLPASRAPPWGGNEARRDRRAPDEAQPTRLQRRRRELESEDAARAGATRGARASARPSSTSPAPHRRPRRPRRPAPAASSSSSPRGEARGPEVELALGAVRVAHGRPLVQHTGRRVEGLAVLEEAHREGGRERREREPSAGPRRAGDPRRRPQARRVPPSSPKPPWHRQSDGVELVAVRRASRTSSCSNVHAEPLGGRRVAGERDEVG